jgi:hypothetical protein
VRGRAGPVFANIFLPTLKNTEPRGRSGRLLQLENREFSLGSLVGDIGKQLTMEQQQLFTLKATTEPDDALATLKSSQHFGEHQMMEKRTIYSWFSSRTMERSLLVGFHGNRLVLWSPWQRFVRAWRQPSTVHISIVRRRIWGLGMLLRSSDELNNVREADDAGGRTADERQHQTLLRSPQKMPNSRRQLCRALDTLACFGRWKNLTIYLGISLHDGRLDVVLILPPFAKLGIDQLLTYASLCWRTRRLSLLSPPLLYTQLDPKL